MDQQSIGPVCARAIHFHQTGNLAEAERLYREAIAAEPQAFLPRYLLGVIRFHTGRSAEALDLVGSALTLQENAEAFNIQGLILNALERPAEALDSIAQALALEPDYAEAWNNRGNILQQLARPREALESLNKALALEPGAAEIWNNRAVVLQQLDRLEDALASADKGLAIAATARIWNNHGLILQAMRRLDDAIASYDRAIAADPAYADAHWNKGLCCLLQGRLDPGLRLYEWRKARTEATGRRRYPQPEWPGGDIAGKTLFVHAEQGLGDTIQFCRYALLAAKTANVILSVQDGLVRLLSGLGPGITVVDSRTVPAHFDFHIPLLSMPLAFAADAIPAPVPYLQAEPWRAATWRALIGDHGFRIGVSWQGLPHGTVERGRSFPLAQLAEIAAMPGVRLISLQKNAGSEQLDTLPPGMVVETLGDGLDAGADAFLDSAAVMESLDLVITSDTAIAHLAGALGRPVWVALQHVPDWRWFLDRADSPWYPTMTLFRQPLRGDWASVFAAMHARLAAR